MYHIHTLHRPVMDESVCYIPPPHSLSHQQLLSIFLFLFTPYVCVMKRETLGRRILTSETQPVRRNSPIWWPCAPSLFFSLCGRWVFFLLLLLLLSVGRLKIAPLNKIIITFHITKRVKIKFWKIQIQKKNPPIHWNVAMKTGKEEYKNQEKNWLLKNYPQKI